MEDGALGQSQNVTIATRSAYGTAALQINRLILKIE